MSSPEISQQFHIKQELSSIRYMPLKYTLMAFFLTLIISVLLVSSIADYINTRNTLTHLYNDFQQQTENNLNTVIKLVDTSHQLLRDSMQQRLQHYLTQLQHTYQPTAPLEQRIQTLSPHSAQHQLIIQLFDLNGQRLLSSSAEAPPLPATVQAQVIQKKSVVYSGLNTEQQQAVRYSAAQLTPDARYILWITLLSGEFQTLMSELNLTRITQRLRNLNTVLDRVHLLNLSQFATDSPQYTIVQNVLQTRIPYVEQQPQQNRIVKYTYLGLDNTEQAQVLQWHYNMRALQDGLKQTVGLNLLIAIVAISLSILLTLFIANRITKPLQQLVNSVNIIASGNLEHCLEGQVRNELKVLKKSILLMVQNMLAYIEDIEQKHQQNTELKQLNKMKDEFLSNTSHELRTPIHGIIGITESLLDGAVGELNEKVRNNLSMIVISSRRLINLVSDILDFSRLKHNDIQLNIQPVDTRVIADIVLTLSEPLIDKKPIQLINAIEEHVVVAADENRLQQILHNLIGNAIKFTEQGSITISARRLETMLEIKISDTGIGIAPEQLTRIFNAFEQGDGSIVRIYGGTGLGLAITRQLIELHGGQIHVKSKIKQGTTLYFTLPLSITTLSQSATVQEMLSRVRNNMNQHRLLSDAQPQTRKAAAIPTATEIKLTTPSLDLAELSQPATEQHPKLRILVIDDDPINRQVLENQLLLENYQVTLASDGFAGLQALEEKIPYALVLLDVMMPKISGLEVCKIIRERWSLNQLPIIMLTARNQISDLVEGLQGGANDYLTKPFSRNELSSRIKTHIHLSQVSIAYSHFVPLEFLHLLEKDSILDVKLGNHVQKVMTVLFADIRSFTSLSESMTPEENFIFLNGYLRYVSPVIRRHRGFIDKYIGDAMMALFPETVDDALNAAIEIHYELEVFNQTRHQQQLKPIRIGVGLHTGLLTLGTIGEENRMESTVISDVVNLASRIEGLTKLYGSSIIVSEQVLKQLSDPQRYEYRFLGKLRVKGKQQPTHIFEILDSDPADVRAVKIRLKHLFDSALNNYYERNFIQAAGKFFHILTEHKEDKAASFYIRRCEYYMKHGVPDDWEGVETIEEK